MGFYDYEAEDVRGNMRSMREYEGKVVLVVNTATKCGFTPQYDELQSIYEQYDPRDLRFWIFRATSLNIRHREPTRRSLHSAMPTLESHSRTTGRSMSTGSMRCRCISI